MKTNLLNNNYSGSSSGKGTVETKESRALNISLIRARESSRIRKNKIEWFSL